MKQGEIELVLSEHKITPEKIGSIIEEMVWQYDISYWEAVVDFMNKEGIEPEQFRSMISPGLWEKIRNELEDLNMVKKEARVF